MTGRFPQPDGSEIEEFQATLDGLFSVNGSPYSPFHAEGPAMTRVNYPGGGGGPLGTFSTEMLSLNFVGARSFFFDRLGKELEQGRGGLRSCHRPAFGKPDR